MISTQNSGYLTKVIKKRHENEHLTKIADLLPQIKIFKKKLCTVPINYTVMTSKSLNVSGSVSYLY